MNKYFKGRRIEYRVKKLLEAQGYSCVRSAGSHGLFDIIAINADQIRGIQVKSGQKALSTAEREALRALKVPENMTKECWHYPVRARAPIVEVL